MDGSGSPPGERGKGSDCRYAFWLGEQQGVNFGEGAIQSSGKADLLPGPDGFTDRFDKAIRTITTERGKDYGHPKDDFNRAHRLTQVADECPHPEIRHALRMICVKVARLIQTPDHIDSIIDIAGYARCIAMILDKK